MGWVEMSYLDEFKIGLNLDGWKKILIPIG
jgi:hypothetical protein